MPMRKVLSIIIFLLSILIIRGLNDYTLITSKILYEFNDIKQNLSNEQIKETISELDEISVLTRVNYKEFVFENNLPDDATMEQVDAYKEAKRAYGKKYHESINKKIASTLGISGYTNYYVSSYLPFIEYSFDKETYEKNKDIILSKTTSNKDVSCVTIKSSKNDYEEHMLTALGTGHASSFYNDTDDYLGRGIKIGILETGIMDVSHVNFTNTTCLAYDQPWYNDTVTLHATTVASIIGGTYGIAPKAELYSTGITGNILNEVDWLINRGVDVINMSYGEANPTGVYSSDSSFIDYTVKNYDIVAVGAVGNGGEDGYVGNPALGYNVISVGVVNNAGQPDIDNSLKVANGPRKPTFLAPGSGMTIQNIGPGNTGSSFSAAFTTGCVALLLEEYPILKTKPMLVLSLFATGCVMMEDYSEPTAGNGLNAIVGAGKLDLTKTMDTFYKQTTITNNYTESLNGSMVQVFEYSVYIAGNQNLRCVFSVPATVNYNNNTAEFSDYIACIFDENDICLAVGGMLNNNVMMASCIVPEMGTYYMRLYIVSPLAYSGEQIYYAYRYR